MPKREFSTRSEISSAITSSAERQHDIDARVGELHVERAAFSRFIGRVTSW